MLISRKIRRTVSKEYESEFQAQGICPCASLADVSAKASLRRVNYRHAAISLLLFYLYFATC